MATSAKSKIKRRRAKKLKTCPTKRARRRMSAKAKARLKAQGCRPRRPHPKQAPRAGGTTPAAILPPPSAPQGPAPKVPAPPKPPAPATVPDLPPAPEQPPGPDQPPPPPPPDRPAPVTGAPVYGGTFGRREAERLLWRAGFGPRPGDVDRLVGLGLEAAVHELTRPSGQAKLSGPAGHDEGEPLSPTDAWGHDHLYWLDRMVRSDQQLVERLALVFHDWFATSLDGVGSQRLMLAQTNLFRAEGLGNFHRLVRGITQDGAMCIFLDAVSNDRWGINENYARELMELFTLGAGSDAYTEHDVRELARSLSGWSGDWSSEEGWHNFRWEWERWDAGIKTVFGQTGRWDWEAACRMVVEHPKHAGFFVRKLWSYFVAVPPPDATAAALEALYVDSGGEIRPVVEAILCSPELYTGPAMVKPPVVAAAGMLRAVGGAVDGGWWWWNAAEAGQRLYLPPDVAGWREDRWLDTSTVRGRWQVVSSLLYERALDPEDDYPAETPAQAVAAALAFWGNPPLADDTREALVAWAGRVMPARPYASLHPQRQNALRQLIGACPDYQTS
ncbi:MAG TPA: DUF1800 domain-containing protein [Solirubrobacteraceae bacterium]